jgi:hypothetical protein
MKRNLFVVAVLAASVVSAAAGEMSEAEREDFLRTATIMSRKGISMGITGSSKAILQAGETEHAAHVQTVDESKVRFEGSRGVEMNFRDSYKFNIAAYELAKMLDLNTVPASVERKVNGQRAAVTWWVDDVRMTELERRKKRLEPPNPLNWHRQMAVVKVFDELIFNTDRNQGNLVITNGWQIHMIDHTRAFRMSKACPNLKKLTTIERRLLTKLRELEFAAVQDRLGAYLTGFEIKGLLARRDQIVKEFDARIQTKGEQTVVYELHAAVR